jgi:type IV pilus assembly protein PilB
MPPVKSFGERIADALVEDGLLSAKQVEELLEQQKKAGTRLLKIILEKAYVSEQDMTVSMGRVLNVPPINLLRVSIPLDVADLLPREVAHNHKVVPVSRLENKLFIAMADPLNVLALDDVKRITKLEVAPMIASEKSIIDKSPRAAAWRTSSSMRKRKQRKPARTGTNRLKRFANPRKRSILINWPLRAKRRRLSNWQT